MTDDAKRRTALDDAIDEVAQGMTLCPPPDVRRHVADRLDAHGWTVRWWQAALITAVAVVAIVMWWPTPDVSAPPTAPMRVAATPSVPEPAARELRQSVSQPATTVTAIRRSRSTPPSGNPSSDAIRSLPAIEVAPIVIDGLDVEPAVSAEMANVPRLVLEPLDVEPLARSNQ